ncbi:FAD-dependent oxidoreductase [Sphingosinicella soli]|uniref:Succinate dehydrogenase/fumarate reductase flavoprotein subunit n=1 Tax=Sphingosinicella soli TaxID=333708 RepID=A0A7W7B093_9SPHN|nr:FAD-dependent oxidoreductase [Sphingosinicella soli]MBB4631636.1 succinate dehydrogenase/fumarate reductase flavoprotein subunit [Sphingosinicella soli]
MKADVVVVGSGAAGLTAAITAAKAGLQVVVLEAAPVFGGTTAFSGGGVWIPANHHQKELGVDDSRAEAIDYLKSVLGNFYDAEIIETYLDTAPEMLRYLEANSEVLLTSSTIPDYSPDAPGWKTGRCLLTADYDGAKLGGDFALLRPPIPEMGLFHSMQVSPADAYRLQHWYSSIGEAFWSLKRFAGYLLTRLGGSRGKHLANGNALAGRLLKSARDAGVVLINNARARALVTEAGQVTGVIFEREGQEETAEAARGVVLASGGFGANAEMRRKYIPQADAGWSLQPEGSQGDGVMMGVAVGGMINEGNAANAIWVPASATTREDGSLAKFPSLSFDRHCPGSIMVDARNGRRFVDESFHYQNFGETVLEKGITRIWQISDAAAVGKYGLGMVKPKPFSPKPWVKQGYVKEASTIAALAAKIGLDPAVLEKTVEDFNRYADAGKDPDFARGENYYSSYMGDASHKPNPALGALRKPPFYALEVRLSDLSSLAGLDTNARAQVLAKDGSPIPGLYAAGLDNNTIMRGRYPGGGSSLGPAMTFGYIAARHMADAE